MRLRLEGTTNSVQTVGRKELELVKEREDKSREWGGGQRGGKETEKMGLNRVRKEGKGKEKLTDRGRKGMEVKGNEMKEERRGK